MKALFKVLASVAGVLLAGYLVAADGLKKEARVTRIIRDVKVLPTDSPARPAATDERARDNTGVRTGDESRSELTFVDLTITRLGANTIFSFSRGGRSADLDSGSMLLRVPKDSGGGTICRKSEPDWQLQAGSLCSPRGVFSVTGVSRLSPILVRQLERSRNHQKDFYRKGKHTAL